MAFPVLPQCQALAAIQDSFRHLKLCTNTYIHTYTNTYIYLLGDCFVHCVFRCWLLCPDNWLQSGWWHFQQSFVSSYVKIVFYNLWLVSKRSVEPISWAEENSGRLPVIVRRSQRVTKESREGSLKVWRNHTDRTELTMMVAMKEQLCRHTWTRDSQGKPRWKVTKNFFLCICSLVVLE